MALKLTAVFRKVPEGYIGFVEELPGANTQGRTLEEARENLQARPGGQSSARRRGARGLRGHPGTPPDPGVKRRDLVRHLRAHGCELLRDLRGSGHTAAVATSMMNHEIDHVAGDEDCDPIPDEFASVPEAGEFWDTHDLTDYEDQTRETDFKVDLRPQHPVKKSPPKP